MEMAMKRSARARLATGLLVAAGLLPLASGCSTGNWSLSKLAWWKRGDGLNLTARHEDYLAPPSRQFTPTPSALAGDAAPKSPSRAPYSSDMPTGPQPVMVGQSTGTVSYEYPASTVTDSTAARGAPDNRFAQNPNAGTNFGSTNLAGAPGAGSTYPSAATNAGSTYAAQPGFGSSNRSELASQGTSPYAAAGGTFNPPTAATTPATRPQFPPGGAAGVVPQAPSIQTVSGQDSPNSTGNTAANAGFYEYPSTPHSQFVPQPRTGAPTGGTNASGGAGTGGQSGNIGWNSQVNPYTSPPTPSRSSGAAATTPAGGVPSSGPPLPRSLIEGQGTYAPGSIRSLVPLTPQSVQPPLGVPPTSIAPTSTAPAPSSNFSGGSFQPN
jgi:hypothetical protein